VPCRRGFDVLFVDTAKMLTHPAGGHADGTHEQRLARYTRPDLLALDDFGLKPFKAPGAEDLYDVINERYEKGSIARTSNRDRAEWSDLFGEASSPRPPVTAWPTAPTSLKSRAPVSALSTPRSKPRPGGAGPPTEHGGAPLTDTEEPGHLTALALDG